MNLPNSDKIDVFYGETVRYYDECADFYENLYPDHLKFSRELFGLVAPNLRTHGVRRILDASCGEGCDLALLYGLGFSVDGSDISERMLARARERMNKLGATSCKIFKADARFLCKEVSDQYDCVIFRGNTLGSIAPSDRKALFNGLIEVLRPGGILVLDYRAGERLFRKKSAFEYRGMGFDRKAGVAYLSYYTMKHPMSMDLPYHIEAHIHFIHWSGRPLHKHVILFIPAQYVSEQSVLACLDDRVLRTRVPETSAKGLPHLHTIICVKN
jgi:SAM-dependent methyltransferase